MKIVPVGKYLIVQLDEEKTERDPHDLLGDLGDVISGTIVSGEMMLYPSGMIRPGSRILFKAYMDYVKGQAFVEHDDVVGYEETSQPVTQVPSPNPAPIAVPATAAIAPIATEPPKVAAPPAGHYMAETLSQD